MKKAIVIGGAGFTGIALAYDLIKNGYIVYDIIRPNSPHKSRLDHIDANLKIIECDLSGLASLSSGINGGADVMFYIAWTADEGYYGQSQNVLYLNCALDLAAKLGCKRVVITGSQAEYGVVPKNEIIYEDRAPNPFSDYGASKVAACYLSKQYAKDLGIEWVWGRIFSLIGKNEPETRMLPALYKALYEGRDFALSSCRQNWDYLDVQDAAAALIALAEHGKSGEIYNIANGHYRELKEYTEELRRIVRSSARVIYGNDPSPFVSLQPSVEKIQNDTGWKAEHSFEESIHDYSYMCLGERGDFG